MTERLNGKAEDAAFVVLENPSGDVCKVLWSLGSSQ